MVGMRKGLIFPLDFIKGFQYASSFSTMEVIWLHFSLHSDRVVTSLISQAVPLSIWHRLVAGLNAQLRLVCRGNLNTTFLPVLKWLETHANPAMNTYRVHVDLAWFQTIALGYCQFGLVLHVVEGLVASELQGGSVIITEQHSVNQNTYAGSQLSHSRINDALLRKRIIGTILNVEKLKMIKDRRDLFYPLCLILHNTKPVGHQDLLKRSFLLPLYRNVTINYLILSLVCEVCVELSFMEAVQGCRKTITYEADTFCGTCNGSGVPPGTVPKTCKGSGAV